MINQAKQPLGFTPPGPAIDAAKLRGKSITFVSLAQSVPTIADAATETEQAAAVVGIHVNVYDAMGDVTRMQQGITQAVAQKQSAIILLGIPTDVTQPALAQAAKAGIPVVAELDNEPIPGAPGQGAGPNIYGTTAPSYYQTGRELACKAVLDMKGKANVVIFGAQELKPSAKEVEGMRSILSQCSGCTVAQNSTPVADWQTALPPKTESVIRANPNVNYLMPLYDGMGIFVTAGVREALGTGKVFVDSFNGTPAALQLVKSGPIFTADPGQSPGWLAWGGLDQAMRGMLHLPPGKPSVPVRFFDMQNLQGVNVNSHAALYGDQYVAGFKKLWGVQ